MSFVPDFLRVKKWTAGTVKGTEMRQIFEPILVEILMMACMMFNDEKNVIPFYVEAEEYLGLRRLMKYNV